MSAEITAPWYRLQLDLFNKLGRSTPHGAVSARRPSPPLVIPERLNAHCEELYELIASLNNIPQSLHACRRRQSTVLR